MPGDEVSPNGCIVCGQKGYNAFGTHAEHFTFRISVFVSNIMKLLRPLRMSAFCFIAWLLIQFKRRANPIFVRGWPALLHTKIFLIHVTLQSCWLLGWPRPSSPCHPSRVQQRRYAARSCAFRNVLQEQWHVYSIFLMTFELSYAGQRATLSVRSRPAGEHRTKDCDCQIADKNL